MQPDFVRKANAANAVVVVADDEGRILGVVRSDALGGAAGKTWGELAGDNYLLVAENSLWIDVLAGMNAEQADLVLVSQDRTTNQAKDISGVISIDDIARRARTTAMLMR